MASNVRLAKVLVEYGGRRVLYVPELDIAAGESVGIFGSNGSGKSTLLKVITGHVPCRSGDVLLGGTNVTRWPAHRRVRTCDIGYVAQSSGTVRDLTVEENLFLGGRHRSRRGQTDSGEYEQMLTEMQGTCPELRHAWEHLMQRRRLLAGDLSGGEQRLLSVMMMLVKAPKTLILDEPLAGVASLMNDLILGMIKHLRGRGVSILIVEQHVIETIPNVSRALVLRSGVITYDGTPDVLEDRAFVLSLL